MANADHRPDGRICTKCGEFKLFELFGNQPKGRWGKNSRCKSCDTEYRRKNHARLREYWTNRQRRVRAEKRAARLVYTVPYPETMKPCSRCKRLADKSEFHACATWADGLQKQCRKCRAEVCRKDLINNRDRVNRTRKKRRKENPGKARQEYKNNYRKAIEKHGESHYLRCRISNGIRRGLKYGKQGKKAFDVLSFSLEELRVHLERQFLHGMSWDNFNKWDIDHIRPIASFNIETVDDPDFKLAWCLTNLRPLWRTDNCKKCAKITHLI